MPSSATTEVYALSLHDALPIFDEGGGRRQIRGLHAALGLRIFAETGRPVAFVGFPGRARREGIRDEIVDGASAGRQEIQQMQRDRSEEHTSELQSRPHLVCRLLLPPRSTLFPYTTLFRSSMRAAVAGRSAVFTQHWACVSLLRQVVPLHLLDFLAVPGAKGSVTRSLTVQVLVARKSNKCNGTDRKSTRLNSSHVRISYAVFCYHRGLRSFPTRRSSDLR